MLCVCRVYRCPGVLGVEEILSRSFPLEKKAGLHRDLQILCSERKEPVVDLRFLAGLLRKCKQLSPSYSFFNCLSHTCSFSPPALFRPHDERQFSRQEGLLWPASGAIYPPGKGIVALSRTGGSFPLVLFFCFFFFLSFLPPNNHRDIWVCV